MRRGNKVRYKKHLEFIVSETDRETGEISIEDIISYNNKIGEVNYRDKIVYRIPNEQEFTPMNWKHLRWALGRAKNRTKIDTWEIVG